MVVYILLGVLIAVVGFFAMRSNGAEERKKSYEERRDAVYERYEQRMEEYKATEMKKDDSSEEEQ